MVIILEKSWNIFASVSVCRIVLCLHCGLVCVRLLRSWCGAQGPPPMSRRTFSWCSDQTAESRSKCLSQFCICARIVTRRILRSADISICLLSVFVFLFCFLYYIILYLLLKLPLLPFRFVLQSIITMHVLITAGHQLFIPTFRLRRAARRILGCFGCGAYC